MATDGQVIPSAMQLSTFTKVTSIPKEESYKDFPVAVRVKAPEMTFHEHALVDIVAVIDVSGTMGWNYVNGSAVPNHRLELVKEAMKKVIENLGGAQNRLAVVPFSDKVIEAGVTPLTEMTKEGQQRVQKTVDGLKPGGGTAFRAPLQKAAQILDDRKAVEDRLAFIIFLSDGKDTYGFSKEDIPRAYQIHTFGISEDHSAEALQNMATVTSGSYTTITNNDLDKITEKMDQLSDKLSSIVAVDMSIYLKSLNPGVSLLRIESCTADDTSSKSQISDNKLSANIFVRTISSSEEREFTAYLHVPESQGNGSKGVMELLTVGGRYNQSWDRKQITLSESVVTIERPGSTPPAPSSCKELNWIEERVEYWCKVKLDLSAMYDKAEAEAGVTVSGGESQCQCQCQDLQTLRAGSLVAIDRAMHHDIYTATLLAVKLRHCSRGGAAEPATENAPSTTAQGAKAV
ncbi:hypothetical protein SETIT_7G008900v2 [Setaria italica]|uniref:VWFA domain-containing protein n=1 Tax=Setaria italica TaxID=4555 RepID=K3Y765_SETIT|nr:uncharacterized protein LOC101781407 [Setaria italica]RCV32510.1 hypothetical protein SETIT_7G008900v2 [Setaria italica]